MRSSLDGLERLDGIKEESDDALPYESEGLIRRYTKASM